MYKEIGKRQFGTLIVRRHNDGSVQSYIGRYAYRGQRVQRAFGSQGEHAVHAWLEEERMLVDLDRRGVLEWVPPTERKRRLVASELTFVEYADMWLAARRRKDGGRLEGSTKRNIRATVKHLKDAFPEPLLLKDVTPVRIQAWYDADHDYGPWSFVHCCEKLRAMLKDACNTGPNGEPPILEVNPFALPIPPTPYVEKHDEPAISDTELLGLYLAMPDYTRLSILIAATAGGMRIGELCALTVTNFDLERKLLHIRGSAVRDENDLGPTHRGKTKTPRSRRTVPLPDALIPLIRAHIEQWCENQPEYPFFTPKRGGECLCRNVLGGHILKAREAIGRPDVTFHTLRATQATVMLVLGGTPREAADQLGHTDPSITMTYYQRIVTPHRAEVLSKTSDALLGAVSNMGLLNPDTPLPSPQEWKQICQRLSTANDENNAGETRGKNGDDATLHTLIIELTGQVQRLADILTTEQSSRHVTL